MLELISHVVRISARRDRTEINAAMVDALMDMFSPRELVIYRCYAGKFRTVVYACAGHGEHGPTCAMPPCRTVASAIPSGGTPCSTNAAVSVPRSSTFCRTAVIASYFR